MIAFSSSRTIADSLHSVRLQLFQVQLMQTLSDTLKALHVERAEVLKD